MENPPIEDENDKKKKHASISRREVLIGLGATGITAATLGAVDYALNDRSDGFLSSPGYEDHGEHFYIDRPETLEVLNTLSANEELEIANKKGIMHIAGTGLLAPYMFPDPGVAGISGTKISQNAAGTELIIDYVNANEGVVDRIVLRRNLMSGKLYAERTDGVAI